MDPLEELELQEKKDQFKKSFNDLITYVSAKIIFSFWLIFSLNTFFHTGFPYDFAHILSAWFFMTLILQLLSKNKS
jgi:hypothetical protein